MADGEVNGATGLKQAPFTITKDSEGSTWLSADLADASEWKQILKYSVPLGTAIQVEPTNYHFGEYNATDTTTQITAGKSRVLKKNAAGTESIELWQGSNGIYKDIGDEWQRPKFKTSVFASASQLVTVEVYNLGTTLDSASSDFFIECTQLYEDI